MSVNSYEGTFEPIAIIGYACRLPGATNVETFWELLKNGQDAISEVPAARWNLADYYDPDLTTTGKLNSKWGGFLDNVSDFDPAFFGMSSREAASVDPQQRLLLEVAWEAFENAGLPLAKVKGTETGVYVGIGTSDYTEVAFSQPTNLNAYFISGNVFCMTVNRLSYFYDLRGPSMAIDTGCSSSLVAIHQACLSLQTRETNMALAGGVNLVLSPRGGIALAQTWMLSTAGRCKSFDAAADGYVRGEGCGIAVLKRLSDAEREGNSILAVIRGSAVNQNGHGTALTAPNDTAQKKVIQKALAVAGVAPSQIDYVEAHGVGSAMTDAIEAQSLVAVLGTGRPESTPPFVLGSVKTNIGYLETAAGIAALGKVLLALEHAEIPAHLHFKQLNPKIEPTAASCFTIPVKSVAWKAEQKARLASINSFGLGGTNAHLIIEEYKPKLTKVTKVKTDKYLFTISARSANSLKKLAEKYLGWLAKQAESSLGDICYSVNTGRTDFNHRLALVVGSLAELQQELTAFSQEKSGSWRKVEITPSNSEVNLAEFPENWVVSLSELANLYLQGVKFDWSILYGKPGEANFPYNWVRNLPNYSFDRKRCWHASLSQ